jgi:plasmid stability protein
MAISRSLTMADLLVRGVDEAVVRALRNHPGAHGRSAEAEHGAILAAALLTPPRCKLANLMASMPDGGRDSDVERRPRAGREDAAGGEDVSG